MKERKINLTDLEVGLGINKRGA